MQYTLIDTPSLGNKITTIQALTPNNVSLYRGPEDPQMAEMAPLLFWYQPDEPFAEWVDQSWGKSFGISLITDAIPDEVRKHLRRFLRVKTDDGQQLYFRFYDPRVLTVFLPTCDAEQLQEFFGPIHYFLAEDHDPAFGIIYWLKQGTLNSERIPRQEAKLRLNNPLKRE